MKLAQFLRRRKELPPNPRPGLCRAKTGLGTFCTNAVQDDQSLCDFHKNLAGPWSKPERLFEKFER